MTDQETILVDQELVNNDYLKLKPIKKTTNKYLEGKISDNWVYVDKSKFYTTIYNDFNDLINEIHLSENSGSNSNRGFGVMKSGKARYGSKHMDEYVIPSYILRVELNDPIELDNINIIDIIDWHSNRNTDFKYLINLMISEDQKFHHDCYHELKNDIKEKSSTKVDKCDVECYIEEWEKRTDLLLNKPENFQDVVIENKRQIEKEYSIPDLIEQELQTMECISSKEEIIQYIDIMERQFKHFNPRWYRTLRIIETESDQLRILADTIRKVRNQNLSQISLPRRIDSEQIFAELRDVFEEEYNVKYTIDKESNGYIKIL